MPQNQEEIQVHEATVNFESEAEYGYGIYNLAKRVVSNTVNQTKKNIHHLPFYFDDDKDPAIDSVIDFKSNVSLFKASVNNDDIYLRTHFERVLKHYPALSTVVEYCGSDEFPYTTRNKLVEYIYDLNYNQGKFAAALTKTRLTYDAIIKLRDVALDAAKQIQTEHDKWLVDELSTINSSDFIIT